MKGNFLRQLRARPEQIQSSRRRRRRILRRTSCGISVAVSLNSRAHDGGRAACCFGNQLQMRLKRRIFFMLEQQPVSVALDDGEDIV